MASAGRRFVPLVVVLGLTSLLLLGCGTSSATRGALNTARAELARVHVENLGHVVGRGSFGATGLSGSRPTAFEVVRTDMATNSLMATLDMRMQQVGFSPFVACRPPAVCSWDRRSGQTLIRASAVIKTGGQPWGDESTAHGTVAPGTRVLEVSIVVGG